MKVEDKIPLKGKVQIVNFFMVGTETVFSNIEHS